MGTEIAEIIRKQLTPQTLYMLGAHNMFACENGLVFKIKGSKTFKHIKIVLNSMDTYDMTFTNFRGMNITKVEEVNGVYVDMLHKIIEEKTGLYTKL